MVAHLIRQIHQCPRWHLPRKGNSLLLIWRDYWTLTHMHHITLCTKLSLLCPTRKSSPHCTLQQIPLSILLFSIINSIWANKSGTWRSFSALQARQLFQLLGGGVGHLQEGGETAGLSAATSVWTVDSLIYSSFGFPTSSKSSQLWGALSWSLLGWRFKRYLSSTLFQHGALDWAEYLNLLASRFENYQKAWQP